MVDVATFALGVFVGALLTGLIERRRQRRILIAIWCGEALPDGLGNVGWVTREDGL